MGSVSSSPPEVSFPGSTTALWLLPEFEKLQLRLLGIPRECEVPAIADQFFFIKCISFISHFFAASLIPSQVSVRFSITEYKIIYFIKQFIFRVYFKRSMNQFKGRIEGWGSDYSGDRS